jgi:predicted Zn-dependent protease with MMP-like domain/Tfp pilus assembly protein PilF
VDPSADSLLERASAEREAGRAEPALVCAEEALERAPHSKDALLERALALAELDRTAEARAAVDRALAAWPGDLDALATAAEICVSYVGDRDALEAGRDYALRGASRALHGPRPDRALAARLHLLAGMAENDLGRNRDALAHVETSLRERPGELDALYERGVALFELCRFGPARRAFEAVLHRDPDDAWALHYLGLIAERGGEESRARTLLSRAARLAPKELHPAVEMDRAAFAAEVREAVASLPEADRRALEGVPLEVEEMPALSDLTAVDPPLSPSILGLFRGAPLGEGCPKEEGPYCRSIVLYRRNLLHFARDRAELAEQVRVTLLHEVGHLRGESDEKLRARGLE